MFNQIEGKAFRTWPWHSQHTYPIRLVMSDSFCRKVNYSEDKRITLEVCLNLKSWFSLLNIFILFHTSSLDYADNLYFLFSSIMPFILFFFDSFSLLSISISKIDKIAKDFCKNMPPCRLPLTQYSFIHILFPVPRAPGLMTTCWLRF